MRPLILTEYEKQLVRLIAEGLSDKEIAPMITPKQNPSHPTINPKPNANTIKRQMENLMTKCNCKKRSHLVYIAIKNNWID